MNHLESDQDEQGILEYRSEWRVSKEVTEVADILIRRPKMTAKNYKQVAKIFLFLKISS